MTDTDTQYSAILPAAGRGTRLAFAGPKALYPLLGRPMIAWVAEAVATAQEKFVVSSPAFTNDHIREALGSSWQRVEQSVPLGNVDAILCGVEASSMPTAVIIWGDQPLVTAADVSACISHHISSGAEFTLPIVERTDLYVELIINDGLVTGTRQAREGEPVSARGFSDCGIFIFDVSATKPLLADALASAVGAGGSTNEINIIDLLPKIFGTVNATVFELNEPMISYGVNDVSDAKTCESVLAKRQSGKYQL